MRQKRNQKLLLIVIILVIVLILLIGFSVAYFATDIFKSNKEMFFKYVSQVVDTKENFIEDNLKQYFQVQKTTPYTDEGSLSVNITTDNGQEKFENTNNMNITFSGQVNETEKQQEQNISLNYSDDVKFPLIYKKIEDNVGIQTEHIGSKFIVTNLNNDTSGIISQQDGILEGLSKIQEMSNIELTDEDIQYIQDTYLGFLNTQLQNSNFSKVDGENSKGYKLTLNGENLKTVLVNLLETLKNDQRTLEKLNEYIKVQRNSASITASKIENIIKTINEENFDEYNLEITVYQNNGKTNKLSIKLNEYEFNIEKKIEKNQLGYNIGFQENKNNETNMIALNVNYAGLDSMQNVIEQYTLTLQADKISYQYNYNNNLKFIEASNIEKFNDDNSLILDDLEEEQRNTFISAVTERLQNVNKEQMEKLGLQEDENPLQYVIPQVDIIDLGEKGSQINEMDVNSFNTKFENYASSNLQGVTVKGLITTISINNGLEDEENNDNESQNIDNQYLIKEIHFDGEEYEVNRQNISLIKSNIETESYYRVEFEKDETTGLIYRVVINKK